MSDLKKMVGIAARKEIFFLYCEEDQDGSPYLMMSPTAADLTSVRTAIKKEVKGAVFAHGTVDGTSGKLVFTPKKVNKNLQRDLKTVFSKEAPDLKDAIVSKTLADDEEQQGKKTENPKKKTKKKTEPDQQQDQQQDQGKDRDEDSQQREPDDPEEEALEDEDEDDDEDEDEDEEELEPGILEQIPKIRAGLKLVKEGGATRFFYCLRNENDLPELLIGKKIDPVDIKRLKNGAKQKKFVRGAVQLNEEKVVVFRSKNYSVRPFQKDVTTVFGKRLSRLKKALFEPLGEDNVDEAIAEALENYQSGESEGASAKSTVDAKSAYKALEKARKELDDALKLTFKESSVPAQSLAPLASAFAALEVPTQTAKEDLRKRKDSEEALQVVRHRIEDHERLHQALLVLGRKHAADWGVWHKVSTKVTVLEDFVGGQVKEEWDLIQLTKTTEAVRGPLDDALSLAAQGRYAEAAGRVGEAWGVYEAGQQVAQRSGGARRDFEGREDVQKARAVLEKLKAIDKQELLDGIVGELQANKSLTKEQRRELAAQTYAHLQEQIEIHEGRLLAMRETMMGAAARGLSPEEIQAGFGDVVDEELSGFLTDIGTLSADAEDAAAGGEDGASHMVQMEQHRSQSLQTLEAEHFRPWQEAISRLKAGTEDFEARYAKLDGTGSEAIVGYREQLASLRARSTALMVDTRIDEGRKAAERQLRQAVDEAAIQGATDLILQGHQKTTKPWIEAADAFRKAADALILALDEDIRKQEEVLRQAQTEAGTLLKALTDRVEAYKGYKEIPDAYTAKRDERLQGLRLYVESSNLQVVQQATETMRKLIPGGKGAEFPSVSEAIAMFMATMDRQQSWYNSNDETRQAAALLVEKMKPFDFKKLQDDIGKLRSGPGAVTPALCAELEQRAQKLQEKLEADGLFAAGVDTEISALETEVVASHEVCQKLTTALDALKTLQDEANNLLGKALGNWFFDGDFTGALKTGTDTVRKEAEAVITAGLVQVVLGKAETLIQETRSDWKKVRTERGEEGLQAHIGQQQKDADAEEKKRKEAEERREKEWEAALERYAEVRKAAGSKGVPSTQLEPMDALRDTLKKTHSATQTQEVHDQALRDLGVAVDRLEKLAENPEVFQQTAKKDLATLPKKWGAAVEKYKAGVRGLLSALQSLQAAGEQRTLVLKATRNVEEALELFSEDAFSEPILTITFTADAPDRVKAARERGLLRVRSYQNQINNNPALKAILINPFARVPISDLHKCLGDLDLNLQRCL